MTNAYTATCMECGVPCNPSKKRLKTPRCRKCWFEYIRKNPEEASNYSGGRSVNAAGYVWVLKADHPNANQLGYVFEHRLVVSESIGRPLEKWEVVHHINGIKSDNRIENLVLCVSSNSRKSRTHPVHSAFHKNGRAKLSEAEVINLRKERQHKGTPFRKLAAKYGVTKSTAMRAYYRKSWKHI